MGYVRRLCVNVPYLNSYGGDTKELKKYMYTTQKSQKIIVPRKPLRRKRSPDILIINYKLFGYHTVSSPRI